AELTGRHAWAMVARSVARPRRVLIEQLSSVKTRVGREPAVSPVPLSPDLERWGFDPPRPLRRLCSSMTEIFARDSLRTRGGLLQTSRYRCRGNKRGSLSLG